MEALKFQRNLLMNLIDTPGLPLKKNDRMKAVSLIREFDTIITSVPEETDPNKPDRKNIKNIGSDTENHEKAAEILRNAYRVVLGDSRIYVVDGMHGGILFNNVFDELSDPNRSWDGFRGFPVGFEEFDWPNFAMRRVIENLMLAEKTSGKLAVQIGMGTLESIAKYYPDFISALKDYVEKGVAEIVDGTYAQPFDIIHGDEANIRDFLLGLKTAENLFGIGPIIHVRQEFGFHPQIPQILRNLGYTATSVRVRCNGKIRGIPLSMAEWIGPDGSVIPCLPTYADVSTGDLGGGAIFRKFDMLMAQFLKHKDLYPFVVFTNLEDLTDPMKGRKEFFLANYLTGAPAVITGYSDVFRKEFGGYDPEKYSSPDYRVREAPPEEVVGKGVGKYRYRRDDFFVYWYQGRKGALYKRAEVYARLAPTERLLLDAEIADAVAALSGCAETSAEYIERIWKLYVQAMNHDSISVYVHKTGDYTKARSFLPKYKGPAPGLRCGEKAVKFLDKAAELSLELIFEKLRKIAEDENISKDTPPGGNNTSEFSEKSVLVFNPSGYRPVKGEIPVPPGPFEFILRCNGLPGQVDKNTLRCELGDLYPVLELRIGKPPDKRVGSDKVIRLFMDRFIDYGNTRYAVFTGYSDLPPRSILTGSAGFSRAEFKMWRLDELPEGKFTEGNNIVCVKEITREGTECTIDNGILTVKFRYNRGKLSVVSVKYGRRKHGDNIDRAEIIREGANIIPPVKFPRKSIRIGRYGNCIRVEAGGKKNFIRICMYEDIPTLFCSFRISRKLTFAEFYPELDNPRVFVDYPFGIEETKRKCITARSVLFVTGTASNGKKYSIYITNEGTKRYIITERDIPYEKLPEFLNTDSRRKDDGGRVKIAQQLFAGRVSRYTVTILLETDASFRIADAIAVNTLSKAYISVLPPDYNAKFGSGCFLEVTGENSPKVSCIRIRPDDGRPEIRFVNIDTSPSEFGLHSDLLPVNRMISADFRGRPKKNGTTNNNGVFKLGAFKILTLIGGEKAKFF